MRWVELDMVCAPLKARLNFFSKFKKFCHTRKLELQPSYQERFVNIHQELFKSTSKPNYQRQNLKWTTS